MSAAPSSESAFERPGANLTRSACNVLVIAVFALGIASPLLVGYEQRDEAEVRQQELRELAQRPNTPSTWNELVAYPDRFEAFFNDHFGLRSELLTGHRLFSGKVLGVSPSPRVVIGTDGWLYFTKDRILEDYRGEERLKPWQLRGWQLALEDRQRWFGEHGAKFLFAAAPNKPSIYPQHLPPRMRRPATVAQRLDQLLEHLAQHSDFEILDLRPALRELAREQLAYLVTDSHWNRIGAFRAYEQVAARLAAMGVPLTPLRRDDFEVKYYPAQGDLARMLPGLDYAEEQVPFLIAKQPLPCRKLDLPAAITKVPDSWGMWEPPTAYECPGQEGVLLMFKDSFTYPQMEWFACHFRYSYFLSMRSKSLEPLQVLMQVLHPTVVIEQRVERNMAETPLRLFGQ